MLFSGCANNRGPYEGTSLRDLYPGSWTIPEQIGNDTYLLQGYSTQDALKGGRNKCTILGRQFSMLQLTPHTQQSRATLTFKCI